MKRPHLVIAPILLCSSVLGPTFGCGGGSTPYVDSGSADGVWVATAATTSGYAYVEDNVMAGTSPSTYALVVDVRLSAPGDAGFYLELSALPTSMQADVPLRSLGARLCEIATDACDDAPEGTATVSFDPADCPSGDAESCVGAFSGDFAITGSTIFIGHVEVDYQEGSSGSSGGGCSAGFPTVGTD
jgi:hypothetical protein